jgi:hypothetical protein
MRRPIDICALLCASVLVVCGGCMQSPARSAQEPPLEQMKLARVSGKISVPVDVRYRVNGVAAPGQAVPVDLAFVPRIRGQNLTIEFPRSDTVTIDSGDTPLTEQKAAADQVIRRTLLVTPQRSAGGEVRVLVSMNVEGGRFFGVFSVPLEK